MRHGVAGRKFDRPTAHRVAMFRNLVTDLLRHEQIKTTEAKAKEVRGMAEKMITLGKDGTVHARRMAFSYVNDKDVVKKLFDDIAPRFASRPGGYTRIIKLGPRLGDGAAMAQVELVERGESAAATA
jgi:large subunit ribosomal protein L17